MFCEVSKHTYKHTILWSSENQMKPLKTSQLLFLSVTLKGLSEGLEGRLKKLRTDLISEFFIFGLIYG